MANLPPPIRIDSGSGVHAYWPLDEDVPSDVWKRYATKFKSLCNDYIKIDNAVNIEYLKVKTVDNSISYVDDLSETQIKDMKTKNIKKLLKKKK